MGRLPGHGRPRHKDNRAAATSVSSQAQRKTGALAFHGRQPDLCLLSLRSYTRWRGSQSKVKTVITTLTQTLRISYLSGIEQGSTGGQRQATHALPLGSLSWAAVLRRQVQGTQLGSCSADSHSDPAFLTSSQVRWRLSAQRTYTEEKQESFCYFYRDKTP